MHGRWKILKFSIQGLSKIIFSKRRDDFLRNIAELMLGVVLR